MFLLVALWALPFRVTWSLDLPSQSAGPPDKVYEGDRSSDSALSEWHNLSPYILRLISPPKQTSSTSLPFQSDLVSRPTSSAWAGPPWRSLWGRPVPWWTPACCCTHDSSSPRIRNQLWKVKIVNHHPVKMQPRRQIDKKNEQQNSLDTNYTPIEWVVYVLRCFASTTIFPNLCVSPLTMASKVLARTSLLAGVREDEMPASRITRQGPWDRKVSIYFW